MTSTNDPPRRRRVIGGLGHWSGWSKEIEGNEVEREWEPDQLSWGLVGHGRFWPLF